jgi:hypothetical protein
MGEIIQSNDIGFMNCGLKQLSYSLETYLGDRNWL